MSTNEEFVPQANPLSNYLAHQAEIDAAVHACLEGGRYIRGTQSRAFEKEFGEYLGEGSVVGVGSGTDALVIALRALNIGPGHAVITVSHTAVATVAAIEVVGAQPILVDVDEKSQVISPESLDRTIKAYQDQSISAVIPVHLYGRPANMLAVASVAKTYQLRIIEDCAQAHGATIGKQRVGTFGDIGAFSFYPTKNLGAIGDGGAVFCKEKDLGERARLISEYGWKERYVSEIPGINTRLDEIQAAILRVKLRWLDEENQRRRAIANQYTSGLHDLSELILPGMDHPGHVYHQYVIRYQKREALRNWLHDKGIGTLIHYPVPVHQQPAYQGRLFCDPEGLWVTEQLCKEIISLPIYPQITNEQVERVIQAIRSFFRSGK